MLTKLILRMTHRIWNREISRILCRGYSDRVIDSRQLHILCSAFDPTQKHRLYGPSAHRSFGKDQTECLAAAANAEGKLKTVEDYGKAYRATADGLKLVK